MPRGDNTGPQGQGAVTGRGLGNCSTNTNPNFAGYGRGNARVAGRGNGRGLNQVNRGYNVPYATPSLEDQQKDLKNRLDAVNKQLDK